MRKKSLMTLASLAVVALTAAGSAFSHNSSTPTLKGVVGPGYSIKLTKGGKKVESLKATFQSQRAQMKQLHDAQQEKFLAILTPEQRTQFDALKAERDARHQQQK